MTQRSRGRGTRAPGLLRAGRLASEEPGGRSWEDAEAYGFVSAGGGDWFSRTLRSLPVGARVFTHQGHYALGRPELCVAFAPGRNRIALQRLPFVSDTTSQLPGPQHRWTASQGAMHDEDHEIPRSSYIAVNRSLGAEAKCGKSRSRAAHAAVIPFSRAILQSSRLILGIPHSSASRRWREKKDFAVLLRSRRCPSVSAARTPVANSSRGTFWCIVAMVPPTAARAVSM